MKDRDIEREREVAQKDGKRRSMHRSKN